MCEEIREAEICNNAINKAVGHHKKIRYEKNPTIPSGHSSESDQGTGLVYL